MKVTVKVISIMSKGDSVTSSMDKVKLSSDRRLFFVNSQAVDKNVSERGFGQDAQLSDIAHSDLTAGVYEGGLKVWEGAIDLCNYIDSTIDRVVFIDKSVLEVGCGAALPTILALQKGAKEALVQDFNKSVIECFTKDNFAANNVKLDKCEFYAGDWTDFAQSLNDRKFDVILTAETIYNECMYERLHDLLDTALAPDGLVLIAAKLFYFGVGGSVPAFLEYIKSRGKFDAFDVWTSDTEVPRKVIQLTRKSAR